MHQIGKDPLKAITVGQLLEKTAKKYPERPAVISRYQNQVLTFQNLLDEADALAAGLLKLGITRGDRLGIWAPNMVEWYITKMACGRLGVILVSTYKAINMSGVYELEYCRWLLIRRIRHRKWSIASKRLE